jgi:hypothetical protein
VIALSKPLLALPGQAGLIEFLVTPAAQRAKMWCRLLGGKTNFPMTGVCSGQVISDTSTGFFAAISFSYIMGGKLPSVECSREQL